MNKDFEIAVTLNTDEANEKIDALTAKAQALADLFTIIAEQADRAKKTMPPSTVVDGGFQKNSRMKLSQRWLEKFGGADAEGAALGYEAAPFKVSERCCYYLKEKPCDDWAKGHNSVPYLGLMASEGGRREKSLMMHGCNYYGKSTIRSAPFAIFSRQDILQLALDLNVPIPAEYGEIVRDKDGTLRTTLAQRTGCTMCGFGIQLEQRPNRFDRLRSANPKEWEFWISAADILHSSTITPFAP